jgi:outer membrane receptor protein involved in Fe transport
VDFTTARGAVAAATIRNRGWTASLFVSQFGPGNAEDEALRLRPYSTVGAQLSTRIAKDARLTFDVFNVFDREVRDIDLFAASRLGAQAAIGDTFLFHPAERRGVRLRIRKTF